ncbi:MAG: hypothetical protein AB7E95_06060 [Kiritimatiellales bacterium]
MKKLWIVFAGLLIAGGAMAQTKPFNASLTPDYSVYSRDVTIEGLTLSIWGENPQTSLALGIVNGSTGNSAGLSWAFILNYADNYKGIQWAPINYVTGDFLGWQGGFVNYTGGSMKGLQSGVVNCAGTLTGLQFGLVNYAETGKTGVQIGLVNLIPSNRWFSGLPNELAPGMIFVNWQF